MGVYFWDSEYVRREKGQYSQLMDENHCSGGEGVWEDSAVLSFSLLGCIFIPAFGSCTVTGSIMFKKPNNSWNYELLL